MIALARVMSLSVAAGMLGLPASCGASAWQATESEVETSLIAELAGLVRAGRPHRLEAVLRPIYDASPKSALGGLGPEAAGAALRQLFMQRAGWSLKGLAPGGAEDFSAPTRLVKLMEQRVGARGLGLRELAVLAAALEDLARKESAALLEQSYRSLGLPLDGRTERAQVLQALRLYAEAYLGGGASELLPRLEVEQWKAGSSDDGKLSFQDARRAVLAVQRELSRLKAQECSGGGAELQGPRCLDVSSLYSLCCRGGEDLQAPPPPEPSAWAAARADYPGLWIFSAACFLLSALVVAGPRLLGREEPSEPAADAAAEPAAPAAQEAAEGAAAPSQSAGLLGGSCLALCLACAAAVAADLLDPTVLAPALGAGLVLLAVARLAPQQPTKAKKV